MNKHVLYLLIIVFLSACQMPLPMVSEMEAAEDIACQEQGEQLKSTDINYMLYANRMIDAMINDQIVQEKLSTNRLKLFIKPIRYENNTATIKIDNINTAIKNRIIRSGQFILVDNEQLSHVQFSAVFENKQRKNTHCIEAYEQLIMQLSDTKTGRLIWMEQKQFQ